MTTTRDPGPMALFPLPQEGLGGVGSAFGRTRLRTFIATRWLAVIGQLLAIVFVQFALGFDLPMTACLVVIAASAWLNVVLMLVFPTQRLARPLEASFQFGFDVVQVAVLIGLTGGLSNPFLLMLLAPVSVAAVSLPPRRATLVALLAFVCVTAMAFISLPLVGPEGYLFAIPPVFEWGHYGAATIGLAFFAISAIRVTQDETRLVKALDAAQIVMAREQKISALGALAAATAHELGTPLATIHLVAKEMAADLQPDDPRRADVELLSEQAERCRTILGRLGETQEPGDIVHAHLPLSALLDEASAPYGSRGINLVARTRADESATSRRVPVLKRSPELFHALGAFIENAVSFAAHTVAVTAVYGDELVTIIIEDDGPGFSPSVLPRLGEPYLSERGVGNSGGGNMGLGFFIAKTLVERTGGEVLPFNKTIPETGAVVRLRWPRSVLEAASDWSVNTNDLHKG